MSGKLKIVGVMFLLIFCLDPAVVFAETYNSDVTNVVGEIRYFVNTFPKTAKVEKKCKTTKWTTFTKSFSNYANVMGEWEDVVNRNDCLREDIKALQTELSRINVLALAEAKNCNENLAELENLYRTIHLHIQGFRRYGEDSELELNESQNCPNCKKAKYVGAENTEAIYSSEIYTPEGCVLTQKDAQKWNEKWTKFVKSINLYKNIKTLLVEDEFSLGFNENDYQKAEIDADEWWGDTWNKVYSYRGKNFSFRHLRDGEDSLFELTRLQRLGAGMVTALSELLLPPTIAELVEQNALQFDVYQALFSNEEQIAITEDLSQWQAELKLKYQVSRDIEGDLENYLIAWDNAIKAIIKDKETNESVVLEYSRKLKSITDNHLKNLYGSCKE